MKNSVYALSLLIAAASAHVSFAQTLKTEDDKTIYALGYVVGKSLSNFSLSKSELAIVDKAFADAATGTAPQVDPDAYRTKIGELEKSRGAVKAGGEKSKSKSFLTQAAAEKGAVALPSGLIFLSLKEGSGALPKATDTVKVHYRGTLIDGKEFDSSIKRGQPAEFPLHGVIPCWTEGLQKVKVGGKAKLVCPSAIAYGDQGRPPTIPGGATLVFEVELLGITTK